MNQIRISSFIALSCSALLATSALAAEKVSQPLVYAGYSEAVPADHEVRSAFITMEDGVRIAVDIYLPANAPEQARYPTVLQYTPYQRSTIDQKTGEVFDLSTNGLASFFLSHGYAMVVADMRGTGASTGWIHDFYPPLWQDGKQLVDWIEAQSWSDGNVGMRGASYLGWSQTATASQKPGALKCIMPTVVPLEGSTGEVYPGGIYLQGFLKLWSGGMFYSQRNYNMPEKGLRPTKPVVDEDGDGDLHDEVPLDIDGSGNFLDDPFPPQYSDDRKRDHIYYYATKEHEKNYDYGSWAKDVFFVDGKGPLGYDMYDLGPNAHVRSLMEFGIPIYNVGGWFDGFTRGTFELYSTMKTSNPSRLIIFPGYHGVTAGPYYDYLGEDAKAAWEGLMLEHLRFFDHCLKGIDNGIDREPPIYLYVMNGEGWRAENEWPLAREVARTFYFGDGQALNLEQEKAGTDSYMVDYNHSSTYGQNGGNRWLSVGGKWPDGLPVRTEKDKQTLIYTSSSLTENMEVTGHPLIEFWVSSTADYGDFFVYLEDVEPGGRSVLVTEGQLRAGFAGLVDNDRIIERGAHGIDVLPDVVWHGYEKQHYVERILADNQVVKLKIDLLPTSWVFRKGHRIRISVAGSDYPTYRLHPKLSPANTPEDAGNIVPTITVYRDADRPSSITLPVIPGKNKP